VLVLLAASAPARTATVLEAYTSPSAFAARLGAAGAVQVIDFDDVDTAGQDIVGFEATRYEAATGAVIRSLTDEGQYAGRNFGTREFRAVSPPNAYAPGPIAGVPGTNTTTVVTFSAGGAPGLVAGFGCFFVDADYPDVGPSSLRVFDRDGALLADSGTIAGPNGSRLFRGFVAVDDVEDAPVFAIARAETVSGNEWPPVDVAEGVVLDDFVFSAVPEAPGGLLLAAAAGALALRAGSRPRRSRDPSRRAAGARAPRRRGGTRPQAGTAAQ
jgi:hypothetical protein